MLGPSRTVHDYLEIFNMSLAITGATGYIGSGLSEYLRVRGWSEIIEISRTLPTSPEARCRNFFYGFDYSVDAWKRVLVRTNVVVHLSANTDPVSLSSNSKKSRLEYLSPLENLAEAAYRLKKRPLVLLASTATLYGNVTDKPVDENHEVVCLTIYEELKRQQELFLERCHRESVLEFLIIRLSNVYGPSMRTSRSMNRGVLNRAAAIAMANQHVIYYNEGEYLRDYIYITDVFSAIEELLKTKTARNQLFNVCYGESVTIKEAFRVVVEAARAIGQTGTALESKTRENLDLMATRNFIGSNEKLKRMTTWMPKVDFYRGVSNLIQATRIYP